MIPLDYEDFLMDEFIKDGGIACLDDDLPESFEDWLCELDVDTWIELGEKYGQLIKQGGIK